MFATPRILHVSECYEAGTGAAINSYVRNLPSAEHHLLHAGNMDPAGEPFVSATPLPAGFAARISAVRTAVDLVKPTIVHAHSSWAGVYSRLRRLPVPVIYQPHCLSYEDLARPSWQRRVFRNAELALARRTGAFVALTHHERRLLQGLSGSDNVHMITNTPSTPVDESLTWTFGASRRVLMSGRVAVQKDPKFFADTAALVAQMDPTITFRWMGDGDPALTACLEAVGVEITGWLTPAQVSAELRTGAVYFHSAAYEGFPLSVLDAARVGTPVVVRAIPPFDGTGIDSVRTPAAAAAMIRGIVDDNAEAGRSVSAVAPLREQSSDRAQQAGLERLYAAAGNVDLSASGHRAAAADLPADRRKLPTQRVTSPALDRVPSRSERR